MQTKIETARLLLTPLTIDDKDFILELLNTEGWLKFIGDRKVHSQKDAVNYIKKILNNTAITYWVARLKTVLTPIGIITFIKRDYLEHPDIGFAFLPAYTNNGYAFEATREILSGIKRKADHHYIMATTLPSNTDSIRLLKKLGMELMKETEVNGEWLQLYRMNTKENQTCAG
jgi:ribosomal-protein-alanine N-acetyltransferase